MYIKSNRRELDAQREGDALVVWKLDQLGVSIPTLYRWVPASAQA